MNTKEKFLFIFLQIITLGLIWIYWINKKNNIQNHKDKSQKAKIDIDELIEKLGTLENIKNIDSLQTKIKVSYKNRELVNISDIQAIKGVSGVFINDSFISIIIGKSAATIANEINNKLNNGQ